MVINLDSSNLTGSHWIAISITDNNIIYFDPIAYPMHYLISKFLLLHHKPIIILSTPVQSIFSNKCGYHCIQFLKYDKPFLISSFFTRILQ